MIIIDPTVRKAIFNDGISAFPDECCGFLFGKENGAGHRSITEILVVNNAKEGDKRRRFAISPLDYLRAEQYADEQELLLLGVYHSHPNHPAIPSEHDRVAAQPFFSYVIVSIVEGKPDDLRSWRLTDDASFIEENVGIVTYS
ncbi:MAG: M67 family metallopeptidase [Candidatus Pseudobacter hemicellulosilyticus]|uniref:M67 family metallopeptidase n=1 Tax=Candidatus Pseudobacter hemicellulosilyticus TaxID=3121375 RepID=A0AAJ5WVG7_9BACT|nr:MAG: M67 family metallopeptidase [Pseudobacter sp.]